MTSLTTQLNNTLGSGSETSSSAKVAAANAALIASGLNSTKTNTTTPASTSQTQTDASKLMGTTDQFLNLLLAQLKYQDPTQPMKGTEFIDSISRLSNVEQQINTNTNLANISSILKANNSQIGSPVSYVNQIVDFSSSQFALAKGVSSFGYTLDAKNPPATVNIVIKDASGNVVLNKQGSNEPGANHITWNGTDSAGNKLPDGLYTVAVSYPDPSTVNTSSPTSISVPTFTTGKVTEADFTGNEPALTVSGIQIPLTAIRKLYASGV